MPGKGLNKNSLKKLVILLLLFCWADTSFAQDLEPRRWAQLPTGLNFFGIGYGYVNGDIIFDPVLKIEDGTFDMHQLGASYMRSLSFLGRSARVDLNLPYAAGRWEGLVNNEFVHIRRRGFGDARVRFSMLLYGGPAQTPKEFASSEKSNTVIGAAVAVMIPTGEYSSERLINLGNNRWVVHPQLGITHSRGKWTGELTGAIYIYDDNHHFWRETELETDPLFALQAHLIYTFRPGLWLSLSSAYGWGGEATINGDAKNNPSGNWLNALSFGYPIDRRQGLKVSLLTARTQKPTGADNDSLILAYSIMF